MRSVALQKAVLRACLSVCGLILASCQSDRRSSSPSEGHVVTRGALIQKIVLTGEIAATRGEMITVPKLENWQTNIRWLIEDGTTVKQGDRIADLDTTSVTSTISNRETALRQSRSQLAETQARLRAEIEEKAFEVKRRANELQKAKIAVAVPKELLSSKEIKDRQVAFERARNAFEKASTTLASAQRGAAADLANIHLGVESASRDVAFAQASVELLTLRAPSSGVVITGEIPWESRKLQVGDRVWVGFPLARVPDLSSLQITALLWDVDDGSVRVGDRASITLDAFPERTFNAEVSSIAAVAQELARQSRRRAFKLTLRLLELDRAVMRPGYSVRIVINRVGGDARSLLIPRTSLDFSASRPRVVLSDRSLREVQLGLCNGTHCIALSGIAEGDRLGSSEDLQGSRG